MTRNERLTVRAEGKGRPWKLCYTFLVDLSKRRKTHVPSGRGPSAAGPTSIRTTTSALHCSCPSTLRPKTMSLQSQCPSCGSDSLGPDSAGPFAVENLLPAGTLSLPIAQKCDHSHPTEGWHRFPGKALLPHLTDQDSEMLCHHLVFLVEHKFLAIQCKIGDSGMALILRVYIIPYDLSGVQGKLRVRNETSDLKPARLCMQNVLPRIVQEKSFWDAHDLNPSPSSLCWFLDSNMVSAPILWYLTRNLSAT